MVRKACLVPALMFAAALSVGAGAQEKPIIREGKLTVPIQAPAPINTQPTLAVYVRDGAGYRLHSLQILTITPAGIAHNVVYHDPRVFQEGRNVRMGISVTF